MSSLCHFLLSSLLLFGFTWSIMIDSFVVRIRSYRNDFLRLILADNIAVQVGSVFELIYVVKIQILYQEILFNIWPFPSIFWCWEIKTWIALAFIFLVIQLLGIWTNLIAEEWVTAVANPKLGANSQLWHLAQIRTVAVRANWWFIWKKWLKPWEP